jgi:formylglycine-generating enzyme required for sulfatase activity
MEFATARCDCPFCDEVIASDASAEIVTSGLVCPDCATVGRPEDKFCKKCDRPLLMKEVLQAEVASKKKFQVERDSKKSSASLPSRGRISNVKIAPILAPGTLPSQPGEAVPQSNGSKPSKAISPSSLITPSLPASAMKPGRRSTRVIIVGTVVVILTIVYFAAVLWRVNTTIAEKSEIGKPEPPLGMAYVPGGEFVMGTNKGDEYERPEHKVRVGAFYIDLYEVTCREYEKFVRTTGHAPPPNWKNGQYPDGTAQWPVTGVNWDDANAYAKWEGKRLPTEEEWETAARGSDARRYPWGDEWKVGAANADANSQGHVVDVGMYPAGKSPSGAFDMVGNAWEWTASTLTAYPGGRLDKNPTDDMKVIRGNFWGSQLSKATTTFRRGWPARGNYDYMNTGFRCAKDIDPIPAQGERK